MKVVIPGGTGQVGVVLARAFQAAGHEVVMLSRRPAAAPWRVVTWDGARLGEWAKELDGAKVVINLAGRSVNCRYHAEDGGRCRPLRIEKFHVIIAPDSCGWVPARFGWRGQLFNTKHN